MNTLIKSQVASRSWSDMFLIVNYPIKIVLLIFFLMPLILPTSYAQWQNCIDQGENYSEYKFIPWNAPSKVSELIAAGYLLQVDQSQIKSQKLLIQKEIIVDVDYHFCSGSKIIIVASGTGITVNNDVLFSINDAKLRSCDYMWKGIILNAGARLNMYNSTIEDASIAIDVQGNCELVLYGNNFNKNLNSIKIEVENDAFSPDIINNTFTWSDILKFPNSNNLLLQKGFFIQNSKDVNILSKNIFNNFSNHKFQGIFVYTYFAAAIYCIDNEKLHFSNLEFNNSETGIWLNNSDMNTNFVIDNSKFIYPNGYGLHNQFSDLKLLNTLSNEIIGCEFDMGMKITSCDNTICENNITHDGSHLFEDCNFVEHSNNTNYSNDYIPGNGINNDNAIAIFGVTNAKFTNDSIISDVGINVNACRYIEIEDCNFNSKVRGIYLEGEVGTSGSIKNNYIECPKGGEGIRSFNFNASGLSISNNKISNPSLYSFIGIDLGYTKNLIVQDNEISTLSFDSEQNSGIRMYAFSENNSIKSNIITGSGSNNALDDNVAGFEIEQSPSNTYACNKIANFRVGSIFVWYNDNTDLSHNTFSDYLKEAVLLKNRLGVDPLIGVQKYKFNAFMDQDGNYELRHEGQHPELNTFIVNENSGPFWPNPVVPEEVRKYVPLNIILPYPCNSEMHNEKKYDDLTTVMKKIIEKDEDDIIPELGGPMPALLWNAEWTTYGVLNDNPQIMNENTNAANYYNHTSNEPLGQLYQVDNFIWNILPRISENRNTEIQNAVNTLNTIVTSEIYEQNMKKILEISLAHLLNKTWEWTSTQRQELQQIAAQCSLEGGKAVDISRAMLGIGKLSSMYERGGRCEQILSRESKTSDKLFSISDNPNKGVFEITVTDKFDSGSIEITNSIGQVVYYNDLLKNTSDYEIDLSNSISGLYFVKISIDNKKSFVEKIIISK